MQLLDLFELLYPFAYLFFVCAFLALGRIRPELKSAYWFSGGYAFAALGFLSNFANGFLPIMSIRIMAVALYTFATVFTCIGLVARTNRTISWKLYTPIILLSVTCTTLAICLIPSIQTNKIINDVFTGVFFVGASIIAFYTKGAILNRTISAMYIAFGTVIFLMAPILTSIFKAYNAEFLIFFIHGIWAVIGAVTVLTAYTIHLFKLLEQDANTDPLTGLLNRRGFADMVAPLIADQANTDNKIYALMIDLDHFKAVNDTYGHGNGDKLICLAANTLKMQTPFEQIAARMGGEEFALAFAAPSMLEAKTLAEHMRQTFANLRLETGTDSVSFTASMGIAEGDPRDTLAALLDRADQALYLAKHKGRNCIMTQQDVALKKLQDMNSKDKNSHNPLPSLDNVS